MLKRGCGSAVKSSALQEASLRQPHTPSISGKNDENAATSREHERSRLDEVLVLKMPQLYYTANRVINNFADSEDAVQDGLLAAFRHIDQFRGDSSLSTWLHSIVRNAARMQLRKKSRLRETAIPDDGGANVEDRHREFFVDTSLDPEEECAREERSRRLAEKLHSLSPYCRSAVQLCVIEGLLLREAAERLGVSTGTVKARLHRARKVLGARI